MRLDKFLKVSRIINRRTIANEVCDAKKIKVNNNVAKASYSVKIGDVIEISMAGKTRKIKVLELNEKTTKETAANNYINVE